MITDMAMVTTMIITTIDDHHHHDTRQRTLAGWLLLTAAGIAPCAGALVVILLSIALDVVWAGVIGVIAIALGMAITLSAIGLASMVAHRLIIADGRSQEIGRFTAIAASLIVIATAGTLLLGLARALLPLTWPRRGHQHGCRAPCWGCFACARRARCSRS